MRELKECKAEVFRRSEERIKQRKKARRRVLTWCIPFFLIAVGAVSFLPTLMSAGYDKNGNEAPLRNESIGALEDADGVGGMAASGTSDSFSFSLTWNCYGISSYDSETGKLVKTTDATSPEDYITTYRLTNEQMQEIFLLIEELDITRYPDIYDPHQGGLGSDPSMTLILSVNTGTVQKTVKAEDIALTYECDNDAGQKFLSVCKAIKDILTQTDEWKALPEYEFFYD